MSSDELKPCPFCGATDEVMTTRGFWAGAIPAEAEAANQVGCTVCDIWTPAFDTEEEAIAAWNKRAKHVVGDLAVKIHPRIDWDKTADEFERAAEKLREAITHEEDE